MLNKDRNLFSPYPIRNGSFNSTDLDKVKVPYPLGETLINILRNKLNESSGRTPNCFILYRTLFTYILRYYGFRLSASEISRRASEGWKKLADPARQEYEKIASEYIPKRDFVPSVKNSKDKYKWRIYTEFSDIKRKKNNTFVNKPSKPIATTLLQEPPMTTINAQESTIFPYTELNYINPEVMISEEPFTNILWEANQNLMYPELSMYPELYMINSYVYNDIDSTEIDFQNTCTPTTFQETEYNFGL
ncbi:125_t:CDS:1 [Ambispora gerdemannii]|uniref:125_t:CDS:1 n=1 Tax=Ambispora gerdemannii TaxID=144530 RepID=A0A9N8VDD5_9GLOM|nr:125_t:CDS:1 [Ambispora gerdemannii]